MPAHCVNAARQCAPAQACASSYGERIKGTALAQKGKAQRSGRALVSDPRSRRPSARTLNKGREFRASAASSGSGCPAHSKCSIPPCGASSRRRCRLGKCTGWSCCWPVVAHDRSLAQGVTPVLLFTKLLDGSGCSNASAWTGASTTARNSSAAMPSLMVAPQEIASGNRGDSDAPASIAQERWKREDV